MNKLQVMELEIQLLKAEIYYYSKDFSLIGCVPKMEKKLLKLEMELRVKKIEKLLND